MEEIIDNMINEIIRKFGFEAEETIMFCVACEEENDISYLLSLYLFLIII